MIRDRKHNLFAFLLEDRSSFVFYAVSTSMLLRLPLSIVSYGKARMLRGGNEYRFRIGFKDKENVMKGDICCMRLTYNVI